MATATVRRFGRTAEPVLYEQRRTDSAGSTVGYAATGSRHRHDGQLDNCVRPGMGVGTRGCGYEV